MRCEICGRTFSRISNLNLHIKEQHKDEIDCLKCSFCQRTLVRSFNLKRHYRVIHKLEGKDLKCAMEYKKFTVNYQSYEEARKPVYVLSEQYENISSDEDETIFAMKTEESLNASDHVHSNECNFLDDMSVSSLEIPSDSFVNELLENTEEDAGDEHTPETENCLLDSSASDSEMDTDRDVTVTKSSVCFLINKVTTTHPDGRTEVSRTTQIIYSEDINPEDVDFRSVVSEIAEDVAECLRKGNVREMKGDFSV
uniref:Protein tramtrack, beta isoform n=1 Tax=Magallana gigas TaxID=29159 RepID=K1PJC9_MAGGI